MKTPFKIQSERVRGRVETAKEREKKGETEAEVGHAKNKMKTSSKMKNNFLKRNLVNLAIELKKKIEGLHFLMILKILSEFKMNFT
jgi:hypothetical protein